MIKSVLVVYSPNKLACDTLKKISELEECGVGRENHLLTIATAAASSLENCTDSENIKDACKAFLAVLSEGNPHNKITSNPRSKLIRGMISAMLGRLPVGSYTKKDLREKSIDIIKEGKGHAYEDSPRVAVAFGDRSFFTLTRLEKRRCICKVIENEINRLATHATGKTVTIRAFEKMHLLQRFCRTELITPHDAAIQSALQSSLASGDDIRFRIKPTTGKLVWRVKGVRSYTFQRGVFIIS